MPGDFWTDHATNKPSENNPIRRAKAAMREKIRAQLENLPLHQHVRDSMAACALLETRFPWKNARAVLFYAPMPGEIDVLGLMGPVLEQGKIVAFPRFDPKLKQYVACEVKDPHADLVSG